MNGRPDIVIKHLKKYEYGDIGISSINEREFKRIKGLEVRNWAE